MPRLTSIRSEIEHLAAIHRSIPIFGQITLVLTDGKVITGQVIGGSHRTETRDFGGINSPFEYGGMVRIYSSNKERLDIDYLDIDSAESS